MKSVNIIGLPKHLSFVPVPVCSVNSFTVTAMFVIYFSKLRDLEQFNGLGGKQVAPSSLTSTAAVKLPDYAIAAIAVPVSSLSALFQAHSVFKLWRSSWSSYFAKNIYTWTPLTHSKEGKYLRLHLNIVYSSSVGPTQLVIAMCIARLKHC